MKKKSAKIPIFLMCGTSIKAGERVFVSPKDGKIYPAKFLQLPSLKKDAKAGEIIEL